MNGRSRTACRVSRRSVPNGSASSSPTPPASGALWSPRTGIIDFRRVALAIADEIRAARRGHRDRLARDTHRAARRGRPRGWARRRGASGVARGRLRWPPCGSAGADDRRRRRTRASCRSAGDYYTLDPSARAWSAASSTPCPIPASRSWACISRKRIDGAVWAGPNAVLAFAREGYRRRDIRLGDLASTLAYRGLPAAGGQVPAHRARRDVARLVEAGVRARAPALRAGDPRRPAAVRSVGRAGAGAGAATGRSSTTSASADRGRVLHVRNAPSPAATSSLAIGRVLATTALQRLDGR